MTCASFSSIRFVPGPPLFPCALWSLDLMRRLCPATYALPLSFGSACMAMADGPVADNSAPFGDDAWARFATQGVC